MLFLLIKVVTFPVNLHKLPKLNNKNRKSQAFHGYTAEFYQFIKMITTVHKLRKWKRKGNFPTHPMRSALT